MGLRKRLGTREGLGKAKFANVTGNQAKEGPLEMTTHKALNTPSPISPLLALGCRCLGTYLYIPMLSMFPDLL